MSKPLHVAPDAHDKAIKDCLDAFRYGNIQHALTFAMMAGVDAAYLGVKVNECPLNKPGFTELHLQWLWGHKVASSSNDNAKNQGRLL